MIYNFIPCIKNFTEFKQNVECIKTNEAIAVLLLQNLSRENKKF